jgi:hypothetical protein
MEKQSKQHDECNGGLSVELKVQEVSDRRPLQKTSVFAHVQVPH